MAGLFGEREEINLFAFNRSPVNEVKLWNGEQERKFSINCKTTPDNSAQLDWLFICLKAYHYPECAHWFNHLIHTDTKVLILSNGIELKAPLLPFCPADQLLECLIDCPTERLSERTFQALRKPVFTLPISKLGNVFESLLKEQDVTINQVRDFKTANWKKLIESAAIGAMTCLSGETCWIFQQKNARDLFMDLVEEAVEVARADGARISFDYSVLLLAKLASYSSEKGSSMLTDRLLGRRIELEAKSGAITKIGKRMGIPTPLHSLVCTLLQSTNLNK